MGYWGWRRILTASISVWVVGCSITHNTAPTLVPTLPLITTLVLQIPTTIPPYIPPNPAVNTLAPTPTETIYVVQQGDTLLGIALQFGIELSDLQAVNDDLNPIMLPLGTQLRIPNPVFDEGGNPLLPTTTPLPLSTLPPNCSPTATDNIQCLGLVMNDYDTAIQRVTLWVKLLRTDSTILAEGRVGLEQNLLPSGAAAPYRILFHADWREYAGAVVSLNSADSGRDVQTRYIILEINDQHVDWLDGRYTVSAVLHNPDSQTAHLRRAVITLQDSDGNVTGFRVQQLDQALAAGADLPFQIGAVSNNILTVNHILYVEAERAS